MRISGGRARGIRLHLDCRVDSVRPATDRMREAVFSSLGSLVEGARVLDLFAGSGAYGLEALSRGGASGVWVERDPRVVGCLRRNADAVLKALLPEEPVVAIRRGDVFRLQASEVFDLVFVDPPYDFDDESWRRVGEVLEGLRWGAEGRRLVVEVPGRRQGLVFSGWELCRQLGKSGPDDPGVLIFQPTEER